MKPYYAELKNFKFNSYLWDETIYLVSVYVRRYDNIVLYPKHCLQFKGTLQRGLIYGRRPRQHPNIQDNMSLSQGIQYSIEHKSSAQESRFPYRMRESVVGKPGVSCLPSPCNLVVSEPWQRANTQHR